MKRSILILIFTSFLLINACGPADLSENEKLRNEIIIVHDEVMPKMGQLKSLEKVALQKAEKLEGQEPVDSTRINEFKGLAYDLNHAYESMFEWMHQYDTEDGDRTDEELKKYLDSQMILVKEVNVEMKEVLEKADELLK